MTLQSHLPERGWKHHELSLTSDPHSTLQSHLPERGWKLEYIKLWGAGFEYSFSGAIAV
ncbi:hypothetical protein [Calothrix sp. 336/3]|uniref:hypothetical protein n=1 Tax=Calothrix sp. 336/3 TaxID=1337936 RepID=UPI00143C41A4|nr:hypothetical protein [Calothrix sp. 336/3]